jgi:ElaB/YqjD/DUF883 family membrane-anchored ribosome-binding protein
MLETLLKSKNINSSVEHIRSGVEDAVSAIEEEARELIGKSGEVIKQHPIYSMVGAAAIGFVAGYFLHDSIKSVKH